MYLLAQSDIHNIFSEEERKYRWGMQYEFIFVR